MKSTGALLIRSLALLLCVAGITTIAHAAQPTTAPSVAADPSSQDAPHTGPATSPTTVPTADIAALIARLGDPDFHVRQQATQRLKEIGKPALPALKQALGATDPEVQLRAQTLIDAIERPPLPVPGGPDRLRRMRSVRVTIINGSKTIDAAEGDRTVHIEEDAKGIRMKVAGQVNGKETTQDFAAASADELKQKHPDAYALYEQYAAGPRNALIIQGIGIDRRRLNLPNPPPPPPDPAPQQQPAPPDP